MSDDVCMKAEKKKNTHLFGKNLDPQHQLT